MIQCDVRSATHKISCMWLHCNFIRIKSMIFQWSGQCVVVLEKCCVRPVDLSLSSLLVWDSVVCILAFVHNGVQMGIASSNETWFVDIFFMILALWVETILPKTALSTFCQVFYWQLLTSSQFSPSESAEPKFWAADVGRNQLVP